MKNELLKNISEITEEEQGILGEQNNIDKSLYMTGDDDTINAKKLLEFGKLITIRTHTRFVHFPAHTHDYIEMVYTCSGSATHIINGKKLTLNEGEILIMNPYATHEILPADKNDISVNFIILPQFFGKALEMMGEEETPLRRFIIDCITSRENTDGYLLFRTGDVIPIRNLFENLIYSLYYDSPNKRKINEFTMGLILLQLINYSDRLVHETKEQSIVLQVLKYIEENYQNCSLEEIAEQLHYDVCWLSREIKRKTQKTFTFLIQEKRLSQAAYLLKNANLKVSEIAASVGYSNMSFFHRIFEKKYGMSPKKYRDKSKSLANKLVK